MTDGVGRASFPQRSEPSGSQSLRYLSRYECKYLVSPLVVPQIREFIAPFMQPDRYAGHLGSHQYSICSLYLDAEDLRLYQQTVGGEKNRFKLRIRTYSDDPGASAYFEIKKKTNAIVQKRRVRMERGEVRALLAHGVGRWLADVAPDLAENVSHVRGHLSLIEVKPVMRVRYVREAYESQGGDPVRVTLDTDLAHAVTFDDTLSHTRGRFVSTPVGGVILEVKFTERYPPWVGELVRTFGLNQRSVPKYILCVDHLMMEGRTSVLSMAGFTLPPRRG